MLFGIRMLHKTPKFLGTLVLLGILVGGSATQSRAASGTVNVYYAGSLVNLNENLVGPAFASETGYTYQGNGAGSSAIAAQIKGRLSTPDVVEFADPAINKTLMGSANGNYVSWYFTYARTSLAIGFDPKSKYAREFRLVQHHKLPWYTALLQRGLRIGRTDPNLDPKGYRAIWMANLAQRVYHLKGFEKKIFGASENPSQVFPEEVLITRMLTGQVGAGVFYLSEVRDLGIPYISLPAKVNLGDPKYSTLYATQHFMTKSGQTVKGAPIEYTITIPSTVKNEQGAEVFVQFILSPRVRAISAAHGLLPFKVSIGGDSGAVPASLTQYVGK
ncbi:MAG: extracellular solute-binding protein [Chloroflexota bacterium]|nr:extracellular solute-binding protein [Chloroflexota bacterium]